jgi:hypothetical protein
MEGRETEMSGTTWFSVHVETRAPAEDDAPVEESAADELMTLLEEHGGVVSAGDRTWGATVSVKAASARDAAERGTGLIEDSGTRAGMPAWPQVRSEVVRADVLDEELARPTLPDLVSAPEAGDILGVSPQRVHELARTAGFPEPVYELRTGRLWLRAAIEAYAERRPRRPGRPSRDDVPARAAATSSTVGSLLEERLAEHVQELRSCFSETARLYRSWLPESAGNDAVVWLTSLSGARRPRRWSKNAPDNQALGEVVIRLLDFKSGTRRHLDDERPAATAAGESQRQ